MAVQAADVAQAAPVVAGVVNGPEGESPGWDAVDWRLAEENVRRLRRRVGTAWITWGLLPRADVTVTTIEKDPQTAAVAAQGAWPQFVDLRRGDALEALRETGTFDLIFADAQGGKWAGLDRTIAALRPHGLLVVDDMTATAEWTAEQHTKQGEGRQALLTSPLLTSIELDHGSGVILATRHT